MNIKWDAQGYTANFSFVHQYGGDLLNLLRIEPGMTCLDLGCGNGALTAKLAEAGLRTIGLDASPELLAIAREQHPDIRFIEGDATDFRLDEPVDIIFSNAVFHWIDAARQSALLDCINAALKPGGQFVFEFGGKGNNALIHAALARAFAARRRAYVMPFYFPSVGEYAPMLERAGFRVEYTALFDRPTLLKGDDGLADWIRMFVKTPFSGVPADEADAIIREAAASLAPDLRRDGDWYADYVRIRCKASKIN
ncbi:MAG: methyltransferase domain-containing protein [Clostridia bacterium]|nr:methyltransferase domain-containing protein [Clostridia bacterium]